MYIIPVYTLFILFINISGNFAGKTAFPSNSQIFSQNNKTLPKKIHWVVYRILRKKLIFCWILLCIKFLYVWMHWSE
jgi:hypothetical protein